MNPWTIEHDGAAEHDYVPMDRSEPDDDMECGCRMDDCPVCGIHCTECDGDGWGILGDDFANNDPLWNGPDGQVVRCRNCHGSGKRKDMTYW